LLYTYFRRNAISSCCSTHCYASSASTQIDRVFAILSPRTPSFRIGHVRSFLLRETATDDGDGLGDFGEKKRTLIVTFGAAATVRSNTS
jgi:hypothetical protein